MIDDAQVRKNLSNSVKDGCYYSWMVGMGESYLAAFMLALGFSQLSSAWITTLPLLAGALLQLYTPRGVKRLNSYKRWVVLSASIQALSFFIFLWAASTQNFSEYLLYATASLYWASSMATGPAWNTWISTLVPKALRASFFSRRSRFTYASTLLGLAVGGILLEFGKAKEQTMQVFCILFIFSAIFRFFSAYYLSQLTEPKSLAANTQFLSFREAFFCILQKPYGKILIFLFFFQIAVHISSGFFTPYMLVKLELPYWYYMILTCTIVLAKILAMPFASYLIKKIGLKKTLTIATLGIAPLPIFWLLHNSYYYLFLIQVISGFVWATHELAAFLILFGEIPEKERTSVLTEFNFFHTVGTVGGSLLGGYLFFRYGQNAYAYAIIFYASAVLRFLSTFFIPNAINPIRRASLRIYYRTIGVRPAGGNIAKPIITEIDSSSRKK